MSSMVVGITLLIVIVAIVALVAFIPAIVRWQNHQRHRSGKAGRTGMDALLGRVAVVTDEIRPGRLGRARIDGDYWQVRIPDSCQYVARGGEVVVTGYDSIILDVVPKPDVCRM